MRYKQTVALVALLAIILALTGSAAKTGPGSPLIGALAPAIIPAVMTFYLILLLVNSKWIVEAIAAFFRSRPRHRAEQTNPFVVILTYAIVIVLVVALLRSGLGQTFVTLLQEGARVFSQTGTLSPATPEGLSAFPTSIALQYYIILMFVAIVVASSCLSILGLRRALTYSNRFETIKEEGRLREQALEVVKQALTNLRESGKYQDTILECYRQMCKVLSDEGFRITPTQTAREFASNVSGKLRLGHDFVTGLTFLFEEARYSDHPINDEKRELAVNELHSLQRALASTSRGQP
jgi:hypothetical protein